MITITYINKLLSNGQIFFYFSKSPFTKVFSERLWKLFPSAILVSNFIC